MLPKPPAEVPACRSLDGLAPKFREVVEVVLAQLPDAVVAESTRSFERQAYLYGFGRDYDDGRGIVTHAPSHLTSWHGYGLAVDVMHREYGWNASRLWFRTMGELAKAHELTWGGDWRFTDLPHLQWGRCRDTPSDYARLLYRTRGVGAVWQEVGAL